MNTIVGLIKKVQLITYSGDAQVEMKSYKKWDLRKKFMRPASNLVTTVHNKTGIYSADFAFSDMVVLN